MTEGNRQIGVRIFTDSGVREIRTLLPCIHRRRRWCGWSESNRHSSRNRILKGVVSFLFRTIPHKLATDIAHTPVAQHLPGT